jgi:MFS family permease
MRRIASVNATTAVLMSVCYAVALFHRTAFQGIDAPLRAEFAMSPSEAADLAAVFFWTYLAVMIPAGLLTDAIGARRVAIAGSLVSAAGAAIFCHAQTIVPLALARMLIAAGSAAAFVSLMRFVAVSFPERKATLSGRGILVGNLGAMASGAPLAMLLVAVAWRDVWLGLAVLSVVLAAALWLIAPAAPRAGTQAEQPREPLAELRALLASPYIYLGIVLLAGLAGSFYAFANLVGPRWLAARGFTPVESGWLITILIGGYGLGAAFWGWLGDAEHQRTRSLVVATCGALAGWVAIAAMPAGAAAAMAPLCFVLGVCCGAFVLVYALMTERHPASHAGGVIACVNCGIPLGAAALQSVAGRMPDTDAPRLLIAAGAIAVAAGAILVYDRYVRTGRRGVAARGEATAGR